MITNFNLEQFIKDYVTFRAVSLFEADLNRCHNQLSEKINNKSVLVIGGAGTIGSSYIKAILKFKIKRLFVIDINENGLTELVRDLRSSDQNNIPDDFKTYAINFGDPIFYKLLESEGPFEIIVNFAAHKHVRSEKDAYSVEAMIENNVLRAKRLLDFIVKNPPEHFFCVSTDKAANPVNIMGASKKLMEEVIMSYAEKIPIKTARFANVAFSDGSLLYGFIERFNKKQPLTCPSDVKRFFVSPVESGQLCLIASILGESGDIFFPKLDMKNGMLSFSEIAISLIKTLGYSPDICKSEDEAKQKAALLNNQSKLYPIYFLESDTSGEKLFEEFYTENESLAMNSFINIGIIKNNKQVSVKELSDIMNDLNNLLLKKHNKVDIINILKKYLPNFNHIETGKSLDQKM